METKTYFNLLLLLLILASCVSQSDYDTLLAENGRLKAELDECSFGEGKLVAIIEKVYSEKDYPTARQNIEALIERHPESSRIDDFQNLLISIEKAELAQEKIKEAEEAERIRLENLENTGMWVIRHYVDDFGEPTKSAYITNKDVIKGKFSNSATQDSPLNVDLLITNSNNIAIQLYEYAGNNPVKVYSSEGYLVRIQDDEGKGYNLNATNYSERLTFDKSASWQVHSILLKGGKVMFNIVETDTQTTYYEFTLQNATYYDNAHRIRKE